MWELQVSYAHQVLERRKGSDILVSTDSGAGA